MPRLERGASQKIDNINDLIATFKDDSSDKQTKEECMASLLNMFKPLILKLCKKWSDYFNDEKHRIKSFNELVADAEYWFIYYTQYKYEIDGSATFNTFIKNHLDQRIRYIYECEIKYYNKNIFPDPDKYNVENDDIMDDVIIRYSSEHTTTTDFESDYIDRCINDSRNELAHMILSLIESDSFSYREQLIFKEIVYHGFTHEAMGVKLGISRTRVTQILKKTKTKLYKLMENNEQIWELIDKADITIEDGKW